VYQQLGLHPGELLPEYLYGPHYHSYSNRHGLEPPDGEEDKDCHRGYHEHGLAVSLEPLYEACLSH
jgi:hypothetical protein